MSGVENRVVIVFKNGDEIDAAKSRVIESAGGLRIVRGSQTKDRVLSSMYPWHLIRRVDVRKAL